MEYTNEEFFQMVMIYGEVLQNRRRAAILYKERYPDRKHPSDKFFLRLAERLRETGSVHFKPKGPKAKQPKLEEIDVLAAVAANPKASTRNIARDRGISKSKVHRILKAHGFHQLKAQTAQPLLQQKSPQQKKQKKKQAKSPPELATDDSGWRVSQPQSALPLDFCEREQNLLVIHKLQQALAMTQEKEAHFKTVQENSLPSTGAQSEISQSLDLLERQRNMLKIQQLQKTLAIAHQKETHYKIAQENRTIETNMYDQCDVHIVTFEAPRQQNMLIQQPGSSPGIIPEQSPQQNSSMSVAKSLFPDDIL